MGFTYTLELSEAKLQKKISAMLPMQKSKYFVTVILSEPQVELIEETNLISLYVQIDVSTVKGIKASGNVKLMGKLRYEVQSNEFFLSQLSIEQLKIEKLSGSTLFSVKKMVQYLAQKMLAVSPVYKLTEDKVKHQLVKSMLQSVSVKNKKLLLELNIL